VARRGAEPAAALWLVLGFALVVLAVLGGAMRWLLVTEAGSRWLLAYAPYVEATGFSGALLGDHWHADRLHITWPAPGVADLGRPARRRLTWHWRPHPQPGWESTCSSLARAAPP